ncbi:UDP-N-acetylmuramate dehydrogenase [Agathobacter sp.]
MDQRFLKSVGEQIPELKVLEGEPMKKHTTFRIGGPADFYVEPDEKQIKKLLGIAKECDMPVTVVGNGSNLLVGDGGIRGLTIGIGKGLSKIEVSDNMITAGAGAILAAVASKAAEASLGGMEFAAGIPGSIGGAVVMNAGAYGGEIKDIIVSATVLTADGQIKEITKDELDLSYRHSCVPEKGYIVLGAKLLLCKKPQDEIRAEMAQLREKRVEKQPLEYPSAGSTFKRPEGYFAGKLVMDAGLRGYSVGDAQVSEKHCGFVVNKGNATAADVLALIKDVQQRVSEQFGVQLEPEVKMIGEF